MELDGKAFYEANAGRTDNTRLKEILLTLAEEENRHFEVFKRLMENVKDTSGGDILSGGDTLKKVQNIFEQLAESGGEAPFGAEAIEVWTEALRTEEKSEAFYLEHAEKDDDPKRKDILLKIAHEENNHIQMIDGILMFLKDPSGFAASAQYKNFKSIEGR